MNGQYKALKIIWGLEQCSLLWINEKYQSTNMEMSPIIGNIKKNTTEEHALREL